MHVIGRFRAVQRAVLLILCCLTAQHASAKCNWLRPHTCVDSKNKTEGSKPVPDPIRVTREQANRAGRDIRRATSAAQQANALNADLRRQAVEMLAGHETGQVVEDLTSPGSVASGAALGTVSAGAQALQGAPLSQVFTAQISAPLAAIFRDAIRRYQDEAKPMPSSWRRVLRNHFSEQTINDFRYVVDPRWKSTLPGWTGTVNFGNAVAIGHIVIFPYDPEGSWKWIGHEVFHTVQFRDLGIDGFAERYALHYRDLEQEADEWGALVAATAASLTEDPQDSLADLGSVNNPVAVTDDEDELIVVIDDEDEPIVAVPQQRH